MILLTNDDGVHAPGLLALERAMQRIGNVRIVAPEHNWSASGHTKTMHKPLRVEPVQLEDGSPALACSGSPSDCVALVLLGLLPDQPDLVVSGINPGQNVGQDVTYSGTVSAAWEAVITGVPAIAVSLSSHEEPDYRYAAEFASRLASEVLAARFERPILLNLNVPSLPANQITGIEITRLGRRVYRDVLDERRDPRGHSYYWIGGLPPSGIPEPGTDIGALAEGRVSITPIQLDLTDHLLIDELRQWDLGSPADRQ